MKARRMAREFALKILFLKEFSPEPPTKELVHTFLESFTVEPEASDFGLKILLGLEKSAAELDPLIEGSSKNWTLQRMSAVDRNLLRIAAYEMLLMDPPQPASVAINEAVELAKKYGSEDSPGFINGILDNLAQKRS